MQQAFDTLAASLFQRSSVQECSREEIKTITEQYPYFAPARLLLAKKEWNGSNALSNPDIQTAFLYVNNPLHLQGLLQDGGSATILPGKNKTPVDSAVTDESAAASPEAVTNDFTEQVTPTPLPATEEEKAEIVPATEPVARKQEEQLATDDIPGPGLNNEPAVPNEETVATPGSATITIEQLSEPVADQPLEETELVIDQTVEETAETELKIPQLKIEPIDPAKAELSLTPYHTIDYFASVGIRMREEDKPVDKFGQQLKSFTEWIKVMRKLPANEIIKKTEDAAAEHKVEKLAAHSLTGEHADTEAMAEVWEKQGNIAKATAIYHKLSLLDPAKSAYFAAKIENLKKTN